GVTMKRIAKKILCAVLCLALCAESVFAGWGHLHYGGYQPWWDIFAKRTKGLSCEEERLQRFWDDYYDALGRYYQALHHIDWVAYYKTHGYQINAACGGYGACGGCQRIQFAPVFVSPTMQWAVPNGCLQGPPGGPPCGPMMGGPGMMPGMPGM